MSYFTISKAGRENQDSSMHLLLEDGEAVFAVADGVGGSSSGETSSKTAIELVCEWAKDPQVEFPSLFDAIDIKLKAAVKASNSLSSLATTLTMVTIKEMVAKYAHVGDCRLYLLRGNGLKTLTSDQTEKQKLIDLGVLSRARAENYIRSNVLLSALGSSRGHEIQTGEEPLQTGDILILCSDGFYKAITKQQIVNIKRTLENTEEFIDRLKELALQVEIMDDATVVMAEIEEGKTSGTDHVF